MNYKVLFLFLLLLPACATVSAQNEARDSIVEIMEEDNLADPVYAADTLVANLQKSDLALDIKKWKKSREFAYMTYLDSMLKKTKLAADTMSVNDADASNRTSTSANSGGSSFLESFPGYIFFSAIALFFLGVIVYKVFIKSAVFAGKPKRISTEEGSSDPLQDHDQNAFEQLINSAEAKSNFNLAVRYLYLQTLKKLADEKLIAYTPDKPNYVYANELSEKNYAASFRKLTWNYEHLWYGKFNISQPNYLGLKNNFIEFNHGIG